MAISNNHFLPYKKWPKWVKLNTTSNKLSVVIVGTDSTFLSFLKNIQENTFFLSSLFYYVDDITHYVQTSVPFLLEQVMFKLHSAT